MTTGAGYTMDNKLVDVYVTMQSWLPMSAITGFRAADGDPALC